MEPTIAIVEPVEPASGAMEPTIAIVEPVEPASGAMEPEEQVSLNPRIYHQALHLAVCGPWQEGRPGKWNMRKKRFNSWRLCSLPDGPDFIQMQLGGLDGSHTVLFDPEDLERVQMHTWTVYRVRADLYYVGGYADRKTLKLHRHLRPDLPAGRPIDHLNRNGKDNRRANLDDGGDCKNQNNQGVKSNNKGYLTGVNRDDPHGRWYAAIGTYGKDGYRRKFFPDARHGSREQAYEAACAQRSRWAEEVGNRNGLSPR
jgi:hypothetical protein